MKFPKYRFPQLFLSYLGTILIIGMVTLPLKHFESAFEIQVIAMIYLLPILICTVLWGLTSGILAGLLSFLTFDFLFIQPYLTLHIHKFQDLITLIIFLIIAIVMSQLVNQARESIRLTRIREWESAQMYELIYALAGLTDIQNIAHTLANRISNTFHFNQVEIIVNDPLFNQSLAYRIPDQAENSEPYQFVIPMFTNRNAEGEIHLWIDPNKLTIEETRLLAAFGNQGALAVERVHLFKSENKTRILEESNQLKTSLLNSVSHELRIPLTKIKSSVSSLRNGSANSDVETRTELLVTIEEETDRLNMLVGNLLDMSRIEAGALIPKKQWNSIPDIISSVVPKFRRQIKQHPLELNFSDAFPLVPTDYVMMEQVFTNLLSNSIKYAPANSPILISGKVENTEVQIILINQSPSIPEEYLSHIFDKFFKFTKTDQVTGTGLGLSICKGIIEAHGGKIWAENQPQGFSFIFSLPLSMNGIFPEIPEEDCDG